MDRNYGKNDWGKWFFNELQRRAGNWTRVRADLKRGLSRKPGEHAASFPHVEPLLRRFAEAWNFEWIRSMCYLAASLWGAYGSLEEGSGEMSLPHACKALRGKRRLEQRESDNDKPDAIEARLIRLIDSDPEQLPHRLRQMISLLRNESIDYPLLLWEIINWNLPSRRVQRKWAKEFYSHSEENAGDDSEEQGDGDND
jgi:CRISPR system Cascade subunit CasB